MGNLDIKVDYGSEDKVWSPFERAGGQEALPIRAQGLVGRWKLRALVLGAGAEKGQSCPLVSVPNVGHQVPTG